MRRLRANRAIDAGFTLVEMLVGLVLVGVVASLGLTALLAAQRSADVSLSEHDLVEEARLGLNRVSRELRQAVRVERVVNPDGPSYSADAVTAVQFVGDYNGDACAADIALPGRVGSCPPDDPAAPERLSYCHEPSALAGAAGPRLYVLPGALPATITTCRATGSPILAGRVTTVRLQYRSNEYRFDLSPADSVTTWRELDAAPPPFGNGNGVLDAPELSFLDSIVVDMTLGNAGDRVFRTQVALRNLV